MTHDELSALIASAEFHKFLRVSLVSCDAENQRLQMKLTYDDDYTLHRGSGTYHGGIIASLIDVAGTMVCTMIKGQPTPTIDLRVDFIRSPRQCDLVADAEALKVGRNIGVADIVVRDESGKIYATGRGIFSTAEGG